MLKNFFRFQNSSNLNSYFSRHFLNNKILKNVIFNSSSNFKKNDTEVIIIGAGMAGLSAADYLLKNNIENVLILEASERFGGRVHTVNFGDTICELGAKWINSKIENRNSLYNLAQHTGLINRDIIKRSDYEHYHIMSNGKILKYDLIPLIYFLFENMLDKSEKNSVDYPNVKFYLENEFLKVTKMFLEFELPLAKTTFDILQRDLSTELGCDLTDINMKQLKSIRKSYSNSIYISSGLKDIFKHLLSRLDHRQLIFGKPVGEIKWMNSNSNQQQKVNVNCLDGSNYTADHVICTLPLGSLKTFSEYLFSPNLPKRKLNAISKLGFGSQTKIYLKYTNSIIPWFFGDIKLVWSPEELQNRTEWTKGITEINTTLNSDKILEVKIGGTGSIDSEHYNENIIIENITEILKKLLQNKDIPYPVDIVRSFWSTDSKSLGGLTFLPATCSESDVNDLAETLYDYIDIKMPKLLFAGDATSWDGFGTLEGARYSGIREAQKIINFDNNRKLKIS